MKITSSKAVLSRHQAVVSERALQMFHHFPDDITYKRVNISVAMSQEEIFRKYMSESAQARKKARNARHSTGGNMTIIDNEVSMNQIQAGHRADEEYGEDAPQVHSTLTEICTFFLIFSHRSQIHANRLIFLKC